MPKQIAAFGEDFAHKEIVGALIDRLSVDEGIAVGLTGAMPVAAMDGSSPSCRSI